MTEQQRQWAAADKATVLASRAIAYDTQRLGDITIASLLILWLLACPLLIAAIALLLTWGEITLSLTVLALFAVAVGMVVLSD